MRNGIDFSAGREPMIDGGSMSSGSGTQKISKFTPQSLEIILLRERAFRLQSFSIIEMERQ
jgi:hypothetical protein